MRLCFLFLFCFLLILQEACINDGSHHIFKYYYPIDNLERGLVYEYRPVDSDSLAEEYWYYRSIYTDSSELLTGNYYDHDFNVRQFITEEIVSNGSIIKNYYLFDIDTSGVQREVPAEVLASTAFPFEVRDSGGIFLTKLKWVFQNDPEISTTLIKNRRYQGKTTYNFKNIEHKAVVFDIKELVDDYNNGHWEKQYAGKEIYAKGLGLVYYEKVIDDNFTLKYQLTDTFSMKVLENRFKNK